MNLKSLPTLVLLFAYVMVASQSEAAIWYFGENAGIDFNSGYPKALTNGALNTGEGCATISDENGSLLFYTDGIRVWDKNHLIMPNGSDLNGDPSSSQSAVIVPNPKHLNQYYIFTVKAISQHGGLYYSLVDLTLNGGSGAIIASQKNIKLLEHSAEKIAAVEDNNNGYWVLSYAGITGNENTYDTFHAFRINDKGINPSVKTTFSACSSLDGRGYLKISADATKVMLCNQNLKHVCLHDFDASTGSLNEEIPLKTEYYPYGAEFSPSAEKVYVSTGILFADPNTSLYQFDLTSPDIQKSRVEIHRERTKRGALQLGIDGKIYYARPDRTYLGVINDPENSGLSCNYVNEGVDLNGKKCEQGLPPFIQSYLLAGIQANDNCEGETVKFSLDSSVAADSVSWDFGDGNTSTNKSPTHIYRDSGTYTVTAAINFGSSKRSLNKEVLIFETPEANPVSNYYACDEASLGGSQLFNLKLKDKEALGALSSDLYYVDYFLSMEDVVNHENVLSSNYSNTSTNQEIIAKVYNSKNINCYDTASFLLITEKPPVAYDVDHVIICDDASNDGSELLDLSQFTSSVLNTQLASNYQVTYHLNQSDANSGVNALSEHFQTISNPQLIYARVESNNITNCYDTTNFEITVNNYMSINQPNDMFLCDDASNDGAEVFDLTLQNDDITNGYSEYRITYYESLEEAEERLNAIEGLYENIEKRQELFFRIENTDHLNCYRIGTFFIEVLEYKELEMEAIWYKCTNKSVTLIADKGYDAYLWSTGETTRAITVNAIGDYEVTVTKYHATRPETRCNYSKTIEVVESQTPSIVNIEVQDWSQTNNGFIVTIEGNGDYEYSLNDIDYQDSNIFEDLKTGDYTVYVRNKKGCGKVSESVYALFHPKFFTPNGDGYNDYWQLYFSEQEPDIEVSIFDRYGKFIKKIDPRSKGWDGTLNGVPLPTSDYWFVVNRPSKNEQHKGHFTLKR